MTREFSVVPPGKAAWNTILALVLLVPLAVLGGVLVTSPAPSMATIAPGFGLTVGLCVVVALLLILSLRRLRVSIEDDRLVVRAALYVRRVPLTDLDAKAARLVDLDTAAEWRPALRMNGIGLPGASIGHFRGRPFRRRFFCALTSRQRVLVLPERGGERFLLLSLERPQVLLEALQTRQ